MDLLAYGLPLCAGFLGFVLVYLYLAAASWWEAWHVMLKRSVQLALSISGLALLGWTGHELHGSELSVQPFLGLIAAGLLIPGAWAWRTYQSESTTDLEPKPFSHRVEPDQPPTAGEPPASPEPVELVRVFQLALKPRSRAPSAPPRAPARHPKVSASGQTPVRRSFRKDGT